MKQIPYAGSSGENCVTSTYSNLNKRTIQSTIMNQLYSAFIYVFLNQDFPTLPRYVPETKRHESSEWLNFQICKSTASPKTVVMSFGVGEVWSHESTQ